MKKIKNIKQLQSEKESIKQRQMELEHKLHNDWKDLKESLRPVNILRDSLDSAVKDAFNSRIVSASKGFADKVLNKFNNFFNKF